MEINVGRPLQRNWKFRQNGFWLQSVKLRKTNKSITRVISARTVHIRCQWWVWKYDEKSKIDKPRQVDESTEKNFSERISGSNLPSWTRQIQAIETKVFIWGTIIICCTCKASIVNDSTNDINNDILCFNLKRRSGEIRYKTKSLY